MVEANNQTAESGVPELFDFAKYLPVLADAMGRFEEITNLVNFGDGGQSLRGTKYWPEHLPAATTGATPVTVS